MTLQTILRRLKAKKHPRTWEDAKYVGHSGCFSEVYKAGDYIIKSRRSDKSHIRPEWSLNRIDEELAFFGILRAPSWRVGGWVVQERYRLWRGNEPETWNFCNIDVHYCNVGYDRNGQLIAFDY